jgi:hypothetical protein
MLPEHLVPYTSVIQVFTIFMSDSETALLPIVWYRVLHLVKKIFLLQAVANLVARGPTWIQSTLRRRVSPQAARGLINRMSPHDTKVDNRGKSITTARKSRKFCSRKWPNTRKFDLADPGRRFLTQGWSERRSKYPLKHNWKFRNSRIDH